MKTAHYKFLKRREKSRLSKLKKLHSEMTYVDYMNNQSIFKDDCLHFSSYEYFKNSLSKNKYILDFVSEWIIYFMIDKTITKWLDNNNSLDSICILDPCCGSGQFTHIIIEYLFIKFKEKYPNTEDIVLLTQIIQNNIHSWDINEDTVNICKNRIRTLFKVEPILIEYKNTLLSTLNFDIIIGQAYWGNLLSLEFTNILNSNYENVVFDYISWATKSIKKTGEICFIVPHEITYLPQYILERKYLNDTHFLHSIIDLPLKSSLIDKVIICLNNTCEKNLTIESSSFKELNYCATVPYHLFFNHSKYYKMVLYWDIFYQKIQDSFPLYPLTEIKKYSNFNLNSFNLLLDNSNLISNENYYIYLRKYILNLSLTNNLYENCLKELPKLD